MDVSGLCNRPGFLMLGDWSCDNMTEERAGANDKDS